MDGGNEGEEEGREKRKGGRERDIWFSCTVQSLKEREGKTRQATSGRPLSLSLSLFLSSCSPSPK